jgi:hypothetical protein
VPTLNAAQSVLSAECGFWLLFHPDINCNRRGGSSLLAIAILTADLL